MHLQDTTRLALVCAVIFIQFLILVTNINNFTSLYEEEQSLDTEISAARTEQNNNLADIQRTLNEKFSASQFDNQSLVKVSPSEEEDLQTAEEEQFKEQNQKSKIIIIQ